MDTPRVLLEHYLKQLRLPTVVREFPKLAEQCAKEGATFEQFLLRLVEQEMLDRERRATERRIKAAKFPVSKSLETYDFLALPSLNKKLVVELARCEWIGRRENVLALGNSGTGMLMAASEGAIFAGPVGATAPMPGGGEWPNHHSPA